MAYMRKCDKKYGIAREAINGIMIRHMLFEY